MTSVHVKYLRVGQCRHVECIAARGGRWTMIDFPSFCALIHHPQAGYILFDTGYADHYFAATQQFPQRLYRLALPISLPDDEQLTRQLQALGIHTDDIGRVIVSHYHGDHVAGLRDFPKAQFIASRKDTDDIQTLARQPWRATLQGKLPGLLPNDFNARLSYADDCRNVELPQWMQPFQQGYDLLGDGSLIIVPLPGHSAGQLGLLIPDTDTGPVFLVADACWQLDACREGRLPAGLARLAIHHNHAYQQTFFSLSKLANREPLIRILPSHCNKSWSEFKNE